MEKPSRTLPSMSSSVSQHPSSTSAPSATLNVVSQMVSLAFSNSSSVTPQSSSESWLQNPSNHSQQLTITPITNETTTKLSVFSDNLEIAEVFEHLKLGCEISADSDTDDNEEWDFLNDLKSSNSLSAEDLNTGDDEEISDADDVELSEVLDDLKDLILDKTSSHIEEWDVLNDFNFIFPVRKDVALETKRYEEISDADDDELSEALDDFKHLNPVYEKISSDSEEWDILDDFCHIFPLPDKKALETGRHEEVLFEDEASQYKRGEQDWKEQSLCIVKILHDIFSDRVRLLIKRKEVLKACANHYITPEMEILPLENLEHAWKWVAPKFVNGRKDLEQFCIRFKNANLAAAFEAAFIDAVDIAYTSSTDSLSISMPKTTDYDALSKEIELEFFTKATWCCRFCKTNNGKDKQFCFICKATKPCWCKSSSEVPENHQCVRYTPSKFERTSPWFCNLCETLNEADKFYCAICESDKPLSLY